MKLKKVDWFTADTLHYSINFDRRAAAYLNKALHSDRTQTVDGQSGSLLNRYCADTIGGTEDDTWLTPQNCL